MSEAAPRLALVVHFHQPVGNLDRVVAHATRRCYLPFLRVVEAHPRIPWTLHYSGCLLRWLEAHQPEVPERLDRLVRAGVVELMTGGMEEPILASIPERDQLAQVERMSNLLRARFGVSPKGLWLTERVWEPTLPAVLNRVGVSHTVIDDTSLRAVGVLPGQEAGPWVTEFEGEAVRLVGASRGLRYLIPYGSPEAVMREVDRAGPGGLVVYADDGEKFGEWPDTHEQVYGRRWLDRLLVALEGATDAGRLRVVPVGAAAAAPPRGRVYLPSCSYDEMMRWALPTPARHAMELSLAAVGKGGQEGLRSFVRGAPWQEFLAKYPEVARLHQAMLRVSRKVDRAGRPDAAVEHLHMAQCNCAYWHGTFGGAYLTFLRLELWRQLVLAEQAADLNLGPPPSHGIDVLEVPGGEEIRVWGPWGYATVAPSLGGQVVEFISRGGAANLTAVMGRHQEAYHLPSPDAAPTDQSLEMGISVAPSSPSLDDLVFDTVEVGALRDSIDGRVLDAGYDWEPTSQGVRLRWQGEGVSLEKSIAATAEGLEAVYSLRPTGEIWRGSLRVELRSCPAAPGRTADGVRARRHAGGWVVDQPGATAHLLVETTPPADPEAVQLAAIGATLKGWEEMQQGMSLSWTWNLEATAEQPSEVRILLLPVVSRHLAARARA